MKNTDEVTGRDLALLFKEYASQLSQLAGSHTFGGVFSKYDNEFVDDLELGIEELSRLARMLRAKAAPKPPAAPSASPE
jgi:hypothetical protein